MNFPMKHNKIGNVTSNSYSRSTFNSPEGKMGHIKVTVLRDTGCSGIVVRKSLLNNSQFTGEEQTCMLADGSKLRVPVTQVYIDTPYFVGKVGAWCMENSMYDLIIGNIDGARDQNNPDLSGIKGARSCQRCKS